MSRIRFRACVIWSTWSSYLPLGNAEHSSMKASTHGAIDGWGRYTLPLSIWGETACALATLPPSGTTATRPGIS